jgi:uncharacterized membrane protein
MLNFLSGSVGQSVIWVTTGIILLLVGVWVVRRFRGRIDDDQLPTRDLLTNFRELHQAGEISDEEFRTIKTRLGAKLPSEIRDNGESG